MKNRKVFVKITQTDGSVWFASAPDVANNPEKTLAKIQRAANKRVPGTKYELATSEQYRAYQAGQREAFEAALVLDTLPACEVQS